MSFKSTLLFFKIFSLMIYGLLQTLELFVIAYFLFRLINPKHAFWMHAQLLQLMKIQRFQEWITWTIQVIYSWRIGTKRNHRVLNQNCTVDLQIIRYCECTNSRLLHEICESWHCIDEEKSNGTSLLTNGSLCTIQFSTFLFPLWQ